MKAILVIDDIPEEYFAETISIKYELIYYPDGHMKELGIHGKRRLRPMPEKKPLSQNRGKNHCEYSLLDRLEYQKGFNDCIDEIIGGKK